MSWQCRYRYLSWPMVQVFKVLAGNWSSKSMPITMAQTAKTHLSRRSKILMTLPLLNLMTSTLYTCTLLYKLLGIMHDNQSHWEVRLLNALAIIIAISKAVIFPPLQLNAWLISLTLNSCSMVSHWRLTQLKFARRTSCGKYSGRARKDLLQQLLFSTAVFYSLLLVKVYNFEKSI